MALVVGAALLAGCATRHSPPNWLPYAQTAAREAYGGWITVQLGDGNLAQQVAGELLAVSEDSLYALRDSTVSAFPLTSVRRVLLEVYDPKSSEVGQTTLAGTLLTITHGWWLIITAPLWIIVGTSATASLSHDGMMTVTPADDPRARKVQTPTGRRVLTWKDLAIHSRFPQGMPPGLDRTRLHERPRRVQDKHGKPWPGSISTR